MFWIPSDAKRLSREHQAGPEMCHVLRDLLTARLYGLVRTLASQGKCSGWLDMKKKNGIMSSSWSRVWCVIGKEGNMHVFS